jgi:hypothetical protein
MDGAIIAAAMILNPLARNRRRWEEEQNQLGVEQSGHSFARGQIEQTPMVERSEGINTTT